MDYNNTYIDLSDRAIFQLSGPDTERYLNGQITQNIKKATATTAAATCITNAKGKLQGIGVIRAHEGAILLDVPAELREAMLHRIDMYIIADDVVLEDISDQYGLYHVLAEDTPEGCWSINRYGVAGYDTFTKPDLNILDDAVLENLRITHRVPQWGTELTEDTLPPEALLEETSISYNKGCYIGQEVISRIKSAGKVNRKLTQFLLSSELTVPISIPNPENSDAKPAGEITSICKTSNGFLALGYLTRKWFDVKQFRIDDVTVNTVIPS